jgi:hypothetical protein
MNREEPEEFSGPFDQEAEELDELERTTREAFED